MTEKCDDCGGNGRKIAKNATSAGGTSGYPCPTCGGTGEKPKNQKRQRAAIFITNIF